MDKILPHEKTCMVFMWVVVKMFKTFDHIHEYIISTIHDCRHARFS
jgi:hypothetical protein